VASWEIAAVVAGCILAGSVLTLAALRVLSRRPENLGAHNGRLTPCPPKPKCVCSQAPAGTPHHIEPFQATVAPDEAMQRLRAVLSSWPRTRIVTDKDDYIHAECQSILFRFIDDVEFFLDRAAGVIHCRSASRAGHSDLGVNRRRIEAMRTAFTRVSHRG
jgi:uncharacterized protein (DUF1499 family)